MAEGLGPEGRAAGLRGRVRGLAEGHLRGHWGQADGGWGQGDLETQLQGAGGPGEAPGSVLCVVEAGGTSQDGLALQRPGRLPKDSMCPLEQRMSHQEPQPGTLGSTAPPTDSGTGGQTLRPGAWPDGGPARSSRAGPAPPPPGRAGHPASEEPGPDTELGGSAAGPPGVLAQATSLTSRHTRLEVSPHIFVVLWLQPGPEAPLVGSTHFQGRGGWAVTAQGTRLHGHPPSPPPPPSIQMLGPGSCWPFSQCPSEPVGAGGSCPAPHQLGPA